MTKLIDLINPPSQGKDITDHFGFFNNQFVGLKAMRYLKNPSVLTNGDFSVLGTGGLTPVTNAQGNNAVVAQGWSVYGATGGTYTITPTPYPANSTIKSASGQYLNFAIIGYTGLTLFIYQRQPETVRQYQQDKLTYGLQVKNNGTEQIGLTVDVYFNYGTTDKLISSGIVYVAAGSTTDPTATITTPSLQGIAVDNTNYTEFRLNFVSMPGGIANIDIYTIKCELGELSTPF